MRPHQYSSLGSKALPCPNDALSRACHAGAIPPAGNRACLSLSAWSHAIPNTTTEHEQVPTSITKKHNMSMCYRRQAANVGGREMVLGRIFGCNNGWQAGRINVQNKLHYYHPLTDAILCCYQLFPQERGLCRI